jgi:NADPH-dependent 2,4-dienoyl-CoA reductase/sulfur reductase-like enzyme
MPARSFLQRSRRDEVTVGTKVVVIGAGNVGCDAAAEAARLGAESVIRIDIQEPASFGAERKAAEAAGAKFLWPRRTEAITDTEVILTDGEALPADTVIMAIGDQPDLEFLPEDVATERGFIRVDETGQSSDPRVFAIGDSVRLGLLTEAIGTGRTAARAIDDLLRGRHETYDRLPVIEKGRVKLEYYDPRIQSFADADACARQCASCGACRDCRVCETVCPSSAIERTEEGDGSFTYDVLPERCIGCGFCVGACPTGVWRLVENDPLP